MESGDYDRTTNDDQQQEARRNRRVDYRFLIPSRDAGGLIFEFFPFIHVMWYFFVQQLLVKVVKLFKNFV